MSEKKSTSRYRNFATVVYPDSAPTDWLSILSDQLVPSFVSPLHNQDVNPTGEIKKAHYHVIIFFEGAKSLDQAKEVFDLIGGVGCEVVKSLRAYSRYLCHLDNPDKAQYAVEDVKSLSGADYMGVIGLAIDKYKAIGEMIDFCVSEGVISYSDLLMYARLNRFDWFRILCDCGTLVMKEFLKSRSWTLANVKDAEDAEDA